MPDFRFPLIFPVLLPISDVMFLGDPARSSEIAELATSVREDLQRQVEIANQQLARYARDLGQLAEREREEAQALAAANEKLRAYALELKQSVDRERQRSKDLEDAYLETLRRLMHASVFKDNETGEHMQRLSHYSIVLALEVGIPISEADLIASAAPMHDLGKIGIPDRILHKPGPFNAEEWAIMRQHPEIGASLLEGSRSPLLETARMVALSHHERWDGSGYPFGLKGASIPLAARVVAIGDCYDALRSSRIYKVGFTHQRACQIMLEGDGRTVPSHFDPVLLEAFRRTHPRFDAVFDSIRDPDPVPASRVLA